ncbi:helix-turn-helix domain-containing protein [Corynebacterium ulcerans]|uniref:helix-turn-helix domain-containing protein n=1 Tax=Corynebacterium ulcerans TaxID=65058 RepID=UPI00021418DA|nr:helix-turn-helix transcriptional regulator [Corynebacterium ulcerans]AEG84677.1 hypothetical protein CULC22_01972 [Corynebacterium ulcerans BR-AD22]
MTCTQWWKYLSGLMDGDNATEAAKKSGISSSNFTRWKKGARADPDFVVKIARAYDANVLEALVAAEFITEAEAKLREIKVGGIALSDASNQQLLDEIMRRSDPEANRLFGDPTGESIDYQQRDDLAKRRRSTPATPPSVKPQDYDAILDGINAGTEQIAAQKATDPLDENYT